MIKRIFIGYDQREPEAWNVCARSLIVRASQPITLEPINSVMMRAAGLYTRPESIQDGRLFDNISSAAMSTQFSIARFMAPYLAKNSGWILFVDSDFLFRADVSELFALADDRFAVMCVKHDHAPAQTVKMDGQAQTKYVRKNWSSLMLLNTHHEAVSGLSPAMVNSFTGAALHRFAWCADEHIGELPLAWNWLAGYSDPAIDPKAVHFTSGIPSMPGYEKSAFADEWFDYARG